LDTVNLSPAAQRATPKDVKLITELEECLSKTMGNKAPTRGEIFNGLVHARSDISSLTTEQVLRKDCKLLKTPEITIAIPAVPLLCTVLHTSITLA
jgi:exopolyphosphatase